MHIFGGVFRDKVTFVFLFLAKLNKKGIYYYDSKQDIKQK